MMVKRILLTGDDGYDSLGTRILVHGLADTFDLTIAGTKTQQSGVGGHISMKNGCGYGEALVDGIRAYWVDGHPVDAVESAVGYFEKSFDLVISGINWGANIGNGVSSGTVSAAMRAVTIGLAPKAMIFSWDLPPNAWLHADTSDTSLESLYAYPGEQVSRLVMKAIEQNFWGADVVNINLPKKQSSIAWFSRPITDMRDFYNYPVDRDTNSNHFTYPTKALRNVTRNRKWLDTGALANGVISIGLWNTSCLNETLYNQLKDVELMI